MLEQLYKTEFCAVPSVQTMDRGIVFDSVDNCGADTILGFGKPIINLPKNKNSSTESPINLRRHVVCADFFQLTGYNRRCSPKSPAGNFLSPANKYEYRQIKVGD